MTKDIDVSIAEQLALDLVLCGRVNLAAYETTVDGEAVSFTEEDFHRYQQSTAFQEAFVRYTEEKENDKDGKAVMMARAGLEMAIPKVTAMVMATNDPKVAIAGATFLQSVAKAKPAEDRNAMAVGGYVPIVVGVGIPGISAPMIDITPQQRQLEE